MPFKRLLISALLVLAGCSESQPDLESLMGAVVRIVVIQPSGARGATGSGFVVSEDGHVATTAAAVRNTALVMVVPYGDSGEEPMPAKVVWLSEPHDIAILAVENLDRDPIRIAEPTPQAGTDIFVLGYPEAGCCGANDIAPELKAGAMGRVVRLPQSDGGASRSAIMHSAAIGRGSQGAPLLDSCGAAVGLASLTLDPSGEPPQGIFFGTPAAALMEALKAGDVSYETAGKPCRDR